MSSVPLVNLTERGTSSFYKRKKSIIKKGKNFGNSSMSTKVDS